MNERIKELWENCDEIYTRYPKQGSPINASPDLLEKFAELIVRECAKVLIQHGAYFSGDGEPYHYAAHLIEEHFGVEE